MKLIKIFKKKSLFVLLTAFFSININAIESETGTGDLSDDEMKILELMCGIKSGQYNHRGNHFAASNISDYLVGNSSDSGDINVGTQNKNGEIINTGNYKIPKNYSDLYDGEPYKEYGINENPYLRTGYKPILSKKKNIKAIMIDKRLCDLDLKNDFKPLYEVKPCSETPNGISFNQIMRQLSNNLNPRISASTADEQGFPEAVSHIQENSSASYMGSIDQLKSILDGNEICREDTYAAEGKRKEYCDPQEMTIPQNAWVSSEDGVSLNETMCRIKIDKKIKIGSTLNLNNFYRYSDQMKVMGYATVMCKLVNNTPKLEILENNPSECDTSNMSTFDPNSLEKCRNLCVFTDGLSCSPETIVWKSGKELPRETSTPLASCYSELPFGLLGDTITVDNQHPAFEGKSSFQCSQSNTGEYMWVSMGEYGSVSDVNGISRPLNKCTRK